MKAKEDEGNILVKELNMRIRGRGVALRTGGLRYQ